MCAAAKQMLCGKVNFETTQCWTLTVEEIEIQLVIC